ncbi:hypothetical protein [Streptomyces chromofuscus]|uniref:Uncharacterized protein n=1 Tax=Streptomyces chromofuscus TaxID=42881 RepID=A0A7M2T9I9_STRCW|nr:hypothetical protein [Streptomyces chromofuscus]QOV44605.1 hypothetical protein IPT68_00720 [Streptomyces chromofuscus]GGT01898.1 hypothetical protein GCM10010254_22810 [Streptomyces chromofuscus]
MAEAFAAADVEGAVHAVDLASGAVVGLRPDEPMMPASVFQVPVPVDLFASHARRRRAEGT